MPEPTRGCILTDLTNKTVVRRRKEDDAANQQRFNCTTTHTDALTTSGPVMLVSVAQWANMLSEPQYLLGLAG